MLTAKTCCDEREDLLGGIPTPQKVLVAEFGQYVFGKESPPAAGIARQPGCHAIDAVAVPKSVQPTADQRGSRELVETGVVAHAAVHVRNGRVARIRGQPCCLARMQVLRTVNVEMQVHRPEQLR